MERALGGIALPYWNWTLGGEPHVVTDATYVDEDGVRRENLLRFGLKQNGNRTEVSRIWQVRSDTLITAVDLAQSLVTFEDYSPALESPHNQVHGVRQHFRLEQNTRRQHLCSCRSNSAEICRRSTTLPMILSSGSIV